MASSVGSRNHKDGGGPADEQTGLERSLPRCLAFLRALCIECDAGVSIGEALPAES
jgi:hypothetical protein